MQIMHRLPERKGFFYFVLSQRIYDVNYFNVVQKMFSVDEMLHFKSVLI